MYVPSRSRTPETVMVSHVAAADRRVQTTINLQLSTVIVHSLETQPRVHCKGHTFALAARTGIDNFVQFVQT